MRLCSLTSPLLESRRITRMSGTERATPNLKMTERITKKDGGSSTTNYCPVFMPDDGRRERKKFFPNVIELQVVADNIRATYVFFQINCVTKPHKAKKQNYLENEDVKT